MATGYKWLAGEQVTAADLNQSTFGSAADAGASDAYAITLSANYTYATGDVITFKANTANTGSASLNVMPQGGAALGAKTIKKNKDEDLATGDIKAGQWVTVVYDGTNFQMVSGSKLVIASGVTSRDISTASGDQTIAHGLGTAPRYVRTHTVAADYTYHSTDGSWDGTNTKCIWSSQTGSAGVS